MKNLFIAAVLFGALVACGDDEPLSYTNDVETKPTKTKGSIVGQLETIDYQPIAGATVEAAVGSKLRKTTSGEDGRFVLEGIPGGSSVTVRIHAEGYASVRTSTAIPNQAGEMPLDGGLATIGPLALLPTDSKLEIELLGKGGARLTPPSGSCLADVAWLDRSGTGNDLARGEVRVEARFEGGRMICEGLTNFRALALHGEGVEYSYDRIDADGDGHWDYAGGWNWVPAEELFFGGESVIYRSLRPREDDGLVLIATNLSDEMERPVSADEGVELLFNQPVRLHHVEMEGLLEAEDPTFQVDVNGELARIVPAGGAWEEGQLYTLRLLVSPLSDPTAIEEHFYQLFTSASADPDVTATFDDLNDDGVFNPGEILTIEFSQAVYNRTRTVFDTLGFEVDHDLDGSGTIGDAFGEAGNEIGWPSLTNELVSGRFGKRFSAGTTADVPAGTAYVLRFDLDAEYATAFRPVFAEPLHVEIQAIAP